MKTARNITDRAKRYRAQRNAPQGPKRCNFCGRRQNVDIDHITGDEAEGDPGNLMYLCRSCNTRKGITQARNRIGSRTRQFNPTRKNASFQQFKQHVKTLLGIGPGDPAEATEAIRATAPAKRIEYAERIERTNPFKSDAQRRKFFAMAGRGEISQATLRKWIADNPAAPTFEQYGFAVAHHDRHAHDEGGAIIHATPPALRHRYAQQIARLKRQHGTAGRSQVPF